MQAPQSPDPYKTASAQAGVNRDSSISGAMINNVNQYNPFGSVKYSQTGTNSYVDADGKTVTVPQFTSTTQFSPQQQKLYDQQMQAGQAMNQLGIQQIDRLGGALSQPFSLNGLPRSYNSYNSPGLETNMAGMQQARGVGGAGRGLQSSIDLQNDSAGFGYRGPGVDSSRIGMQQAGGYNYGGMTTVGEYGVERVKLPPGSQVIPLSLIHI